MSGNSKTDISVGDNLRILRKNASLSQEKVAAKLQLMGLPMSREIISQMERNRHGIKISVLLALKEIYHVSSFDEFFIKPAVNLQENGGGTAAGRKKNSRKKG